MYTCIHRRIHTHIHIHIHTCMDIYIYIHLHIYVHIHICIHICICTYVYIYLHNSCMRNCATVQQLPCHGSYCELILSLARTSCRLSFPPALLPLRRAGRPPAGQLPTCLIKKYVQIHASSWRGRRCSVAQASSDHPCWFGPHPVCLWFTLAHGRGSHPRQKSMFAAIFADLITRLRLSSAAGDKEIKSYVRMCLLSEPEVLYRCCRVRPPSFWWT